MADIDAAVRAAGLRLTRPRRRVALALARLGHATPDQVEQEVRRDGDPLAPSTIYRNLSALEAAGLVAQTRLADGPATYHVADHGPHLHLVCRGCAKVDEAPATDAQELLGNLRRRNGFEADVSHLAINGWCATCRSTQ